MANAKEKLESAKLLLDAGKYKDSIGRSYYAIFTSLRAVLSKATSVRVPQSYAVFSMEGLSGSNPEQLAQESIAIKAKNYNCSYKEAEKIHQTLYVPWKLYIKLLSCTAVDNKFSYLLWNWRHSPQRQKLKALRHWIFTLRTRKGRRALRILGINIVSEEKR